jgi:hypothetical protein
VQDGIDRALQTVGHVLYSLIVFGDRPRWPVEGPTLRLARGRVRHRSKYGMLRVDGKGTLNLYGRSANPRRGVRHAWRGVPGTPGRSCSASWIADREHRAHEFERIGVGLPTDQDEIGPDVTVPMIRPVADQRIIATPSVRRKSAA